MPDPHSTQRTRLAPGEVMWTPDAAHLEAAVLTDFARHIERAHGLDFHLDRSPAEGGYDYRALWQWSVENYQDYWSEVWNYFEVAPETSYDTVLADERMPGHGWFAGARLNYAGAILDVAAVQPDAIALIAVDEDDTVQEITWGQLSERVRALACTLRAAGVGKGDRVVAYLPNVPEAIIVFLATASLGAIWSVCGPEIGLASALSRFAQLEPKVLIAASSYRFGGRIHERAEVVAGLLDGIESLDTLIRVPGPAPEPAAAPALRPGVQVLEWADALRAEGDFSPVPVPFEHPLWVVYSSGTTGMPKGIVQGHGGVLLAAYAARLQSDPRPEGSKGMSYTSTTWIMWNSSVSGLLGGGTSVIYDGNPMYPSIDRLWSLVEKFSLAGLSTSPGYLAACEKAGLHPAREHDLSSLKTIGSTGAPLPLHSFQWVYDEFGPEVILRPFSGGTEVGVALAGPAPWLPVYAGEMSGRSLGSWVEAWDEDGTPLTGGVGELVIRRPLPTFPLFFWGDEDGSRYREAYFEVYPDTWRHGDWLSISERGTTLIHGRSDATLNRHGVRMGSADIYQAVETVPQVAESLVVGLELPEGGYWMGLFVQPVPDAEVDDELRERLRRIIREQASPRHVPDEIVAVPAIPHTATGKKLEIPVKRILMGTPATQACKLDAVDAPEAVQWFANFAAERAGGRQ